MSNVSFLSPDSRGRPVFNFPGAWFWPRGSWLLLPHENSAVESSPEVKASDPSATPADPQRLLEHQDTIIEAPIAESGVKVAKCGCVKVRWCFGGVLIVGPFDG